MEASDLLWLSEPITPGGGSVVDRLAPLELVRGQVREEAVPTPRRECGVALLFFWLS